MDKLQEEIELRLKERNIDKNFLEIIPDVTSEQVISSIFEMLSESYNSKMPFNKLLGVEVKEISLDRGVIAIHSREELYGNYMQKILHGGVISSIIDLAGGISAQAHALSKMHGLTIGEMLRRFSKMSTLNLRIDYLRPGAGERFECISKTVRAGNKVAVVQMEMFDNEHNKIAIGTGSYLIG